MLRESVLGYQHHGVCAYTLLASGKSEAFGGGRLNGNIVLVGTHNLGKTSLHGRHVRIDFRPLGTHRGVDVADSISLCGYQLLRSKILLSTFKVSADVSGKW